MKKFKPDIVITDLEHFSSKIATILKIPKIFIDNLHSLSHTDACDFVDPKYNRYKKIQIFGIKLLYLDSDFFFVPSFFDTKVINENECKIIPSLLRNDVIKAKGIPEKGHILFYNSIAMSNDKKLISLLENIKDYNFIIYGFNRDEQYNNIHLKKNCMEGFIEDLASSNAVITNGGFGLISESVYLGKPILSMPIEGQFEQTLNAAFVDKLGYGMFSEKLSENIILEFMGKNKFYSKNLKSYKQVDNSHALELIVDKINELCMRN